MQMRRRICIFALRTCLRIHICLLCGSVRFLFSHLMTKPTKKHVYIACLIKEPPRDKSKKMDVRLAKT